MYETAKLSVLSMLCVRLAVMTGCSRLWEDSNQISEPPFLHIHSSLFSFQNFFLLGREIIRTVEAVKSA